MGQEKLSKGRPLVTVRYEHHLLQSTADAFPEIRIDQLDSPRIAEYQCSSEDGIRVEFK